MHLLPICSRTMMDLLEVARGCHNCDPWNDESLIAFLVSVAGEDIQIGFLTAQVVRQICTEIKDERLTALQLRFDTQNAKTITGIRINPELKTNEAISSGMKEIVERWRAEKIFPDPLDGTYKCRPR